MQAKRPAPAREQVFFNNILNALVVFIPCHPDNLLLFPHECSPAHE